MIISLRSEVAAFDYSIPWLGVGRQLLL